MAHPFPTRIPYPLKTPVTVPPHLGHASAWRCTRCAKVLGICRDGRMHLRFARGHEYFVGFPITATCRGCGTLNERATPAG